MNTFHIKPADALAREAAPQVKALADKYGADVLVAVRGETVHYGNDESEETLYTVSEHPRTHCASDDTSYSWHYVDASEWLDEYDALTA